MTQKKFKPRENSFMLKLFVILTCFAFCHLQSMAVSGLEQNNVKIAAQDPIRGIVTDQQGVPLIGVTVQLDDKTKNVGTITDLNGRFTLLVDTSNPVIIFSYLGYKTQTITVANKNQEIKVLMEESAEILDEVVVVGYGTQKKATLTGAVVSIGADQLKTSTNSNIQQNLAGKLAGLKVITNSSEPGALKSRLDLRGMGEPLIVIDGVVNGIGTFSQLSSEEIESVSVLKDASAAVYGMRAGNGVLLLTTKKGGSDDGKPKIQYNGTYGWSHILNKPETMNAYDWATMINGITESRFSNPQTTYNPEQMEQFKAAPAFDVWDMFMNDYAPQTEHTVSVSGNVGQNDDVQYFMSGGWLNEEGAYKSGSMDYNRVNFRSNITAKIGYGLTANVNVGLINSKRNQPYQEAWNIIKWMWFVPPIHPETGLPQSDIYANGNPDYPAYLGTELNPLINSDTENGGGFRRNRDNIWNIQGSLQWEAPFLKGLVAKFMYNYNRNDGLYQSFNKEYTLYTYQNEQYIPHTYASPSAMIQNVYWSSNKGYQASLNYTGKWNSHALNLLALFEQNQADDQYQGAQRFYTMDFLPHLAAGDNDKTQIIGANYPSMYRRQGLVGRINYDYSGKYLTEFAFRYDGSSKYGAGHRWGFFPSGLVGWRISEEKFFNNAQFLSFIDNLKLRASYGITGDDSGAAYQWASGYNYPGNIYYFGDEKVMSVVDRGATNANFTWYKNKLSNLGVDFDAWDGLFGFTAEYFTRVRTGLPATRNLTIPGVVGIGLPQENLNSDQTSGWEISLTHKSKINTVNLALTGNFMYARTKNLHVERAASTSSFRNWRENTSNRYNDLWWAPEWVGVVTPDMDIFSLPNEGGAYQNSMLSIGDYIHSDLNGDGIVDGEDILPFRNLGYPLIQYGLTIDLAWRGLDLNLHFMGAAKKYVVYNEFLRTPYAFAGQAGALEMHKDRWHKDENGNWVEGFFPRYSELSNNLTFDTRRIMDAGYLRLKSVELGYTIPKKLTKKIGVENFRLYTNGFNLLTFTGLKYMDPEYPGWNVRDIQTGDDATWGYIYPITMNFNFGVNVTF